MRRVTLVIEATFPDDISDQLRGLWTRRDAQPTDRDSLVDLVDQAAGDLTVRVAGMEPPNV